MYSVYTTISHDNLSRRIEHCFKAEIPSLHPIAPKPRLVRLEDDSVSPASNCLDSPGVQSVHDGRPVGISEPEVHCARLVRHAVGQGKARTDVVRAAERNSGSPSHL